MDYTLCNLGGSEALIEAAARLLTDTFTALNKDAWPTLESAMQEVRECVVVPNLCLGAVSANELLGWVGLRPMYKQTWELHPLVVAKAYQHQGLGRRLLAELEARARAEGIIGIVLGTDDETHSTSLSQGELDGRNIWSEISHIKNLNHHPYQFYQRCGYTIVGVIPNANGIRKPDIWMWKSLV